MTTKIPTRAIEDGAVTREKQAAESALPAGALSMFAGSAAPTGWLLCDGSAVSRTTYAALFAAIGTTWGAGNGTTTFGLPDLRGRSPIGAGTGASLSPRALGATGGAETHVLSTGEMPAHGHDIYAGTDSTSGGATGGGASNARGFAGHSVATGLGAVTNFQASAQQAIRNAGGGAAHNNMQPFAVVNYIIKT